MHLVFFCTITEICKKYSKWEEFYQQMSRDTGVVFLCHLGSFVSCFIIHLIIRSSKLCLFHVSRSFLLPFILSLSSFRSSVLNQIFCKFLSDHWLSSFPLLQFSLKITCSIIFQKYTSYPIIFLATKPFMASYLGRKFYIS